MMRMRPQPWFVVGVVCSIGMAHAQSNSRQFTTCTSPESRIRIVSYNILGDGDKYALSKQHAYCPREFIAASSRYPRMIQELKSYDADVVALQEVQVSFASLLSFFIRFLFSLLSIFLLLASTYWF